MAMDMRGLSMFISDIRKCASSRETEQPRIEKELAKVRMKFQKPKDMNGYDRKKYICKLLYIYMLGYDIDFGHMEAINLMSSDKYSEKHIGYLAVTILINENHPLLTLVTNSLKNDLVSGRDYFQCLSLTAIANVGGKEFAEAMGQDVQKVLLARESKAMVRKKASLCLLRLYRKYPEVFTPEAIVEPVLDILVGVDFGVAGTVASLLLGFLTKETGPYASCVGKVIRVLSKIILSKDYTNDYVYYGVPAPWLQIKLFRILQHYPVPADPSLRNSINSVLTKIISASERVRQTEKSRTPSRNNSVNSVLAEAINLSVHYDKDPELLNMSANILGRFITDQKDTNLRYIGLELMSRMTICVEGSVMESIRKHQQTIVLALKDPDISIRRRALDLLFCMCDNSNAGEIVGELLEYLTVADFNIREDLVLKIAILAEKYAMEFSWYVDVILNIISQAGDFVTADVFHRVVQIVTNNEDIQRHAADIVFKAVYSASAHEVAVKVAAYILGEFGYMIADQPECGPMQQFQVLYSKFSLVSTQTHSILLNTFMKFFNMFHDNQQMKDKIKRVFLENRSSMDSEVQQRASEYYVMCSSVISDEIVVTVLENMPAFDLRGTSKVVEAMANKLGDTTDRNLWQEKQQKAESERQSAQTDAPVAKEAEEVAPPTQELDLLGLGDDEPVTAPSAVAPAAAAPKPGGDLLDDFFGATPAPAPQPVAASGGGALDDFFSSPAKPAVAAAPAAAAGGGLDDIFGGGGGGFGGMSAAPAASPPQKDAKWWHLVHNDKGVLYEDSVLQVGAKHEYQGNNGRVALFFGNKAASALSNFSLTIGQAQGLQVATAASVSNVINAKEQLSVTLNIQCTGVYNDVLPTITVSFNGPTGPSAFQAFLPSIAPKFIQPLPLNGAENFMNTWRGVVSVPNPPPHAIFKVPASCDVTASENILKAYKMAPLRAVDNNPNNVVAAGTFNSASGSVPVLANCETNPGANAIRLTVKSNNPVLSDALREALKNALESHK